MSPVVTTAAKATEPISMDRIASADEHECSEDTSRRIVLAAVVFALFADMFIYESIIPILPAFVARWNVSPAAYGFLFSTFAVAVLFTTPLFGVIADRYGRRLPLLAGALGLAASTTLIAVANNFFILFVARVLQGVSGAAIWTSGMALVADLYPRKLRGRAMGTVMTGISMGTLIGPLLGGALFERVGPRVPFYAGSLLAWTGFVLLWKTVPRKQLDRMSPTLSPEATPRLWHVALMSIWKRPAFHAVFAIVALGGMMLCLLEPTLPLHLDRTLGAGPESIGWLFLSATAAYGLFSPLAGFASDRWSRRSIMAIGLISAAAVLPWIAIPTSWPSLVAVMVLFGISCSMMLTPALPEMADAADDEASSDYGAAYAWFNMAYAFGMMIGTGAGGWIASLYGLFAALCVMSAAAIICLPLLIYRKHGAS